MEVSKHCLFIDGFQRIFIPLIKPCRKNKSIVNQPKHASECAGSIFLHLHLKCKISLAG